MVDAARIKAMENAILNRKLLRPQLQMLVDARWLAEGDPNYKLRRNMNATKPAGAARSGDAFDAQHDLPKDFTVDFVAAALDINAAEHGRWLPRLAHPQIHRTGIKVAEGGGVGGRFNYQWSSFFPWEWSANIGVPPKPAEIQTFRRRLVNLTNGRISNGGALIWPFDPRPDWPPASKGGLPYEPELYPNL